MTDPDLPPLERLFYLLLGVIVVLIIVLLLTPK